MRGLLPRFAGIALILAVGTAGSSQTTENAHAPSPIEIKISGPGVAREGQNLLFKVVVTNRSSQPVVIVDRVFAKLWSSLDWHVVDDRGRDVESAPIKPGVFFTDDMGGPFTEEEIHIIRPGAKWVWKQASDPTGLCCGTRSEESRDCLNERVFRHRGVYHFRLHYRFEPRGAEDYTDFGTPARTLSDSTIEVLKKTPPIEVKSNEWIVRIE